MADIEGTLPIGNDGTVEVNALVVSSGTLDSNGAAIVAPQYQPRWNGAPAGPANVPQSADVVVEAAIGTPADPAWTTGSGTLVGLLKSLAGFLASLVSNTTGAATAANQATANTTLATIAANTSTGTSGGATADNQATEIAALATIVTNTGAAATAAAQTTGNASVAATATALGTPADTAWVTGNGSLVALLKGIYGKFLATQPVSLAALPALAAGTNQVGLVTSGGFTQLVQITPTVQAAAYTTGQSIGGLITLTGLGRISGGTGLIQSITATFASGVMPNLDVVFFTGNPTASTITDKTALATATADLAKVIGVIHLTDATLLGAAAPSIVEGEQLAMPYAAGAGTSIVYAAVVTRTAITLGATTDMVLTIRALQD